MNYSKLNSSFSAPGTQNQKDPVKLKAPRGRLISCGKIQIATILNSDTSNPKLLESIIKNADGLEFQHNRSGCHITS